MWKTLFRCGIVGGVIVFLWTMVSWMVLPFHSGGMKKFVDESEVVSTITQYGPKDGIYVIPSMRDRQHEAKDQTFVFVNLKRGVNFGEMGKPMAFGVFVQIVSAMLITYLLLKTKAMKYWNRVFFVTIIGLIAGLIGVLPAWNWWYFPTSWILLDVFDLIVGWFLGGMVIAKLLKN